MSLSPGTTVGPYTIVSKLGEGGMGEVYRATDSRLGRDVALKVLPDDVAGDQDRRARFEREAKALAALNHFNIAQVYGLEDRAIVMELLEGETLRDRLRAGTMPVRKAIDYAIQIARGLAASHERGIIHRDLKPENIFIVNDGHAKILDFGLVREAVREESGQTMTREGTAPGVVMGTTGYMSPEQVRGAAIIRAGRGLRGARRGRQQDPDFRQRRPCAALARRWAGDRLPGRGPRVDERTGAKHRSRTGVRRTETAVRVDTNRVGGARL